MHLAIHVPGLSIVASPNSRVARRRSSQFREVVEQYRACDNERLPSLQAIHTCHDGDRIQRPNLLALAGADAGISCLHAPCLQHLIQSNRLS